MQRQYNKKLNFCDYQPGYRAWLKKKYYKTGENRKLSPRKTGPWVIMEKLPNGVTFKIRNDSSGTVQNVHHDRLIPMKQNDKEIYDNQEAITINRDDVAALSDSESESDYSTLMDENEHQIEHRYPRMVRQHRKLEGSIPWDAIDLPL